MPMTETELTDLLDRLIAGWESEVVEFKRAERAFDSDKLGQYFSALANEANLRGASAGWLVFGIDNGTRAVRGTQYRPDPESLDGVKQAVVQGTEPRATFRDIHELRHPAGRVLLFEVPPAPRGIPIAWQGHYYARAGESLTSLALDKLDAIRRQSADDDWSAVVLPAARAEHLDPEAITQARAAFATRHAGRLTPQEVESWTQEQFLERAGLTVDGGLTRAAVLLLGTDRSRYLLSPLMAELTWKIVGPERAYEHFGPPFLLATTALYQRIRNFQLRLLVPGELIQREVAKYTQQSVLEALHNAIAHQDYRKHARIVVLEHPDRLVVESVGDFVEGTPDEYALGSRVPHTYRNPLLVQAMAELNMIDRLGYGIHQMNRLQAARYLPLPDYDLSEPGIVKLTLYGGVVDPAYTDLLLSRTDLPFEDVLALDRVQKRMPIPDAEARHLRRAGLIEGRKPRYHVSAAVAAVTDTKAQYIRTRAQDDAHYARLVVDYLDKFGGATRGEIDDLLVKHLSDALTEKQKRTKVTNLLTRLRTQGVIRNTGTRRSPHWEIT